MAEGKKRAAVKARKTHAIDAKGARRRQRSAAGPQYRGTYNARALTRTAGQGISITVQIPPLRRSKQLPAKNNQPETEARPRSRRMLRPVLLLPAFILVGLLVFFNGFQSTPEKDTTAPQAAADGRSEPDFNPLIPSAEKASSTKYDGKRNLVSYTTNFSGSRITVSQQKLPDNFTKDPAALLKAADSIKAKHHVATDRGGLFVASNETGDQMAIFADEQVLLFIHADKKLDDASWKSFIELLKAASWSELT